MSIRVRLAAWCRDIFRRPQVDREFDAELRAYLDLLADEKVRAGMTPAAARRAAYLETGGTEPVKDAVREVRIGAAVETTVRDARHALRTLILQPAFTTAAVVTLALAIGATTAILSVVDAVLLRPLPYRDPGRLVVILNQGTGPVAPASFVAWHDRAAAFSRVGAAEAWSTTLTSDGRPERVASLRLTAEVLPMLGVAPMLGRVWSADEAQPGRDHVVVLSYRLWDRVFARDPGIVGRTVSLNGEPYSVIGVMPRTFAFAPFWATHAELWAPLALGSRRFDHGGWSLRVFARLAPGVPLARARAQVAGITADLERTFPNSNADVQVRPLTDLVVGPVRTPLYVILGAVLFVLLIACANVAHMLLARGAARRREMALRAALGASRPRLVRQMLTESLALALLGGAGGVLLALVGVRVLATLGAASIPRVAGTALRLPVLAAALALSAATAVAVGLLPALRATTVRLTESLAAGSRGAGAGETGGRLRGILIASEVALALVLLVGAGLMVRTLAALTARDPGFDPRGVTAAVVSVAGTAESAPGVRLAFYERLLARLRATPGVASASAINHLPIAGDVWGRSFRVEGRPEPASGQWPVATYRVVFPGYFQTMRLPLVRGRDFTSADREGAAGVVIVNEQLARHAWPGEDAIGRRVALNDGTGSLQWRTVVGVVRDAAQDRLTAPAQPEMYLPVLQQPHYLASPEQHFAYMTFVVRAACAPPDAGCRASDLAGAVRRDVRAIDPRVPVSDIQTMTAVMRTATARPRFYLTLLSAFAAVALVLAAVGIYGVTSYAVSRRTHEIGLRLALGARPGQLLRRVVMRSMRVALAGAAVGVTGALALTRLMSGILYGVPARDPATFGAVVALLCGVALVAAWLPARRATRIAPLSALRGE